MKNIDNADKKNCFLGVERSVLGYRWVDRLDKTNFNAVLAMTQKYGIPDMLARVLVGRGIEEGDVNQFLDPTLRDSMPDPSSFADMDKAATRIADAIIKREKVAILGDYDVDGACSSTILARFLRSFGLLVEIHIPDRIVEGYGPNDDAMAQLVHNGASLIVTVDCGSLSEGPIAVAANLGADVVVLDHHQMGDVLPSKALAVVNPNRPDDFSGHGFLCAAGVVFITLAAISRNLRARQFKGQMPDLLALLDLVALATICDVVPLIGVNRAFVVKGLQVARSMNNIGFAALAKAARIGEPLNTFHLGFLIGPRINAGGRIGNSALGSILLGTDNGDQATKIALELEGLNSERQALEAVQLEEAEAQVLFELSQQTTEPSVIVVASPDWHPGIVGLLASRLKERYQRPAIALAIKPDGSATGSARSITGFDVGDLIRRAVEEGLIEKGGGHIMAAGLTINASKINDFRIWCNAEANKRVLTLRQSATLAIDGAISASGATNDFIKLLEKAGPFGAGNDQPIFAIPSHCLVDVREVGKGHVAVTLANAEGRKLKGIAFRSASSDLGTFLLANRGNYIHMVGNLSLNYWNGSYSPQIRIIDAAPA
ncbi:single-stranded-DNA-specific exonuclease RecJ [Bartonella sp. HY329]|uniref:single-stranded-DNA-specific exonuclease RecJ n=1 Tax=unclassified Bartonella TaxID=2645622 RepID=UPI0021CADC7C|nr:MULTISPECIES: single-stranded-DNA-specific exonuclease RecJ [unclassified Bartonella]UXM94402.1 single-stranded-DNA-specific exonuclease RecJ [Bartonella sp. HY329]UXN08725.1 single-stranded-DNA-specific exonuclease RecJ [Bartonella sp. HY328]